MDSTNSATDLGRTALTGVETVSGGGTSVVFGPVRSRRLGLSLGINPIEVKTCSYSCTYCQAGCTVRTRIEREPWSEPEAVAAEVARRLEACRADGLFVDYATFVPNGEPTLDSHLGASIRAVEALGLRTAVLTNGSLLWRQDVREELVSADWVSIKVDTVEDALWRRLNRPVRRLRLEAVLDGMRRFAAMYRGDLVTETMLVAGVNDDEGAIERTARFIGALHPLRAYVAIPTRPPAEPSVEAPDSDRVRRIAAAFRATETPVTCLLGELDDIEPFAPETEIATELLRMVAVHPLPESTVREYLARGGGDWPDVDGLVEQRRLVRVRHGDRSYLRRAIKPI
jgi:wyosine [tRNA(Phe)-imidazoG37] synthetase (radical SAM superfamily)